MVSIGSKALPLRNFKTQNQTVAGDDNSYRNKSMGRRARKSGIYVDRSRETSSGHMPHEKSKSQKSLNHHKESTTQKSHLRKPVDPETAKYFSEIAKAFEGTGVDLEERKVICGNALEETRGKEVELVTDYIISHTLQTLLEACDVDHLCGFLQSCSKVFSCISMDRSGSHVAETALKSLSVHLQDYEARSIIEETLSMICQAILLNPVDVMCNCYGSHVLRSLLCLCKGLAIDSSEFHATKSSVVLADRLNFKASRSDVNGLQHLHEGFPDLLKLLVLNMLNCSREDILMLQVDQYGSLVLQTALKLLAGEEDELLHIIPILLGCSQENRAEGNFIDSTLGQQSRDLMKETAYSHLMEVILEVAPESLFNEMFTKVFRNSIFDISTHYCGNFVVQALISHARSEVQMELLWQELGQKFRDLLKMGRPGVIASFVAACQRLHTHEYKCCQALAAAVRLENESPKCIIPRILFFDSYFYCEDKPNWEWTSGAKMHVIGSLILQSIFRYPSEFIQPFIASMTSMEPVHVLEVAKDAAGARVLEAFLGSDVSAKQKRKVVVKLKGHFGDLSVNPSGSFTVEKCFAASVLSLREAIVSELSSIETELSKTKQGPYLLKKLDVHGFTARPDQWRSKQASKESTYKKFYATFGSTESKMSKIDDFLSGSSNLSTAPQSLKKVKKEIDDNLSANQKFNIQGMRFDGSRQKSKKQKKERNHSEATQAVVTNKTSAYFLENEKPDKLVEKKKRHRKDDHPKPYTKKLKR